jgi:hydrogenase maturation protein HypF
MRNRPRQRLRVTVEGTVQGVGFRPFCHRLAGALGLGGWVANGPGGALVEVEGPAELLEAFLARLRAEAPPAASVARVTAEPVPPLGERAFGIRVGNGRGAKAPVVPPDLAACPECEAERRDPAGRRHRYPFIACTRCGPRFSVIRELPYERAATTMAAFPLCPACRAEYENPADRRFHAEATACPACGPQAALWDWRGAVLARGDRAVRWSAGLLAEGRILAVKALGGFQLWVDAGSEAAVRRLRERKRRPDKPFALLFPSLASVHACAEVSPQEAALLASPAAPIVLLDRKPAALLAEAVAPGLDRVGAMLACAPLQQLLLEGLGRPVVATSGNRSEEPIVTDEREALDRLADIADLWLVHDRPIARPLDDSVARVTDRGPSVLRRARGYAPRAIPLPEPVAAPVLALGGHLKNTVALAFGDQAVLSQHLGDLSTVEARAAFERAVEDLLRLFDRRPAAIACDLHPDYASTGRARELARAWGLPLVPVQHHRAHVASCLAEQGATGEVLGLAWDGAGYGPDGTIWGGEALVVADDRFSRFAHLLPFRLPGGEQAEREPRRAALALTLGLPEGGRPARDLPHDRSLGDQRDSLVAMLERGVASPVTTSMGRLFDAVASLAGLCQVATYEGQAAMALEAAARRGEAEGKGGQGYDLPLLWPEGGRGSLALDWRPLIAEVVADARRGVPAERIARRFHLALADAAVRLAQEAGLSRVALTGGCFQNELLTRLVCGKLEAAGFLVLTHREVPPNDGGLSLGQAVVAGRGKG